MNRLSQEIRILITVSAAGILLLTLFSTAGAVTTKFPEGYESSFPYQNENPQWKTEMSSTWMDWGDTKTFRLGHRGNYTLEVSQFQVDQEKRIVEGAGITIFDADSGEEIATGFYKEGSGVTYVNIRDDFRVAISDVRDAEAGNTGTKWSREDVRAQAKILAESRGLPKTRISNLAFSEKEGFDSTISEVFPDREIWARAKFENDGDAKLYDTSMEINVSRFEVLEVKDSSGTVAEADYDVQGDRLTIDYADVEPSPASDEPSGTMSSGETYTVKLKLRTPLILQKTDVPIEASMDGFDLKKRGYDSSGSKSLTVNALVHVYKSIGPDINPDTDQFEMYLNEKFTVTLRVVNTAPSPVTLNSLTDEVPSQFAMSADQKTEWSDLEIGADSSISLSYEITPTTTGTVSIPSPSANFTWNQPGVASTQVETKKITVGKGSTHGPVITVTKKLNPSTLKPGEAGNVTLTVKNSGDRPAQARLTESAPNAVELVDGLPSRNEVMKAGESYTLNYPFIAPGTPGNYTFPAATVSYEDIVGNSWAASSDRPRLVVEAPEGTGDGGTDTSGSGEAGGDTGSGTGTGGGSGDGTADSLPGTGGDATPTETAATPGPGPLAALALALYALFRRS